MHRMPQMTAWQSTQAPEIAAKGMNMTYFAFLTAIHVIAVVVIVALVVGIRPWIVKKWPRP